MVRNFRGKIAGEIDISTQPTDTGIILSLNRILVADDNRIVRETFADILRARVAHHVATAPDLLSASEILRGEAPFNLIILDLNMPGMSVPDGIVAIRQLAARTPIGIITGSEPSRTVQDTLRLMSVGFTRKQNKPSEILASVRRMVAGAGLYSVD